MNIFLKKTVFIGLLILLYPVQALAILTLKKTGPATIAPGQKVIYQITLTNDTTAGETVNLLDIVPSSLTPGVVQTPVTIGDVTLLGFGFSGQSYEALVNFGTSGESGSVVFKLSATAGQNLPLLIKNTVTGTVTLPSAACTLTPAGRAKLRNLDQFCSSYKGTIDPSQVLTSTVISTTTPVISVICQGINNLNPLAQFILRKNCGC